MKFRGTNRISTKPHRVQVKFVQNFILHHRSNQMRIITQENVSCVTWPKPSNKSYILFIAGDVEQSFIETPSKKSD